MWVGGLICTINPEAAVGSRSASSAQNISACVYVQRSLAIGAVDVSFGRELIEAIARWSEWSHSN